MGPNQMPEKQFQVQRLANRCSQIGPDDQNKLDNSDYLKFGYSETDLKTCPCLQSQGRDFIEPLETVRGSHPLASLAKWGCVEAKSVSPTIIRNPEQYGQPLFNPALAPTDASHM
jgi:hypothetical protein